jgi:hypothetical protein
MFYESPRRLEKVQECPRKFENVLKGSENSKFLKRRYQNILADSRKK